MDKIIELLQNNMGFSLKGLVIFLLPMLPNILFFILLKPNSSLAVANNWFRFKLLILIVLFLLHRYIHGIAQHL